MSADSLYKYSAKPTSNPFRWLLACWRVSQDLTNTNEAAIVEIGFSRSWFGRRVSGWNRVTDELKGNIDLREAIVQRNRLGFVDLQSLEDLPAGTLGRVLAEQCKIKDINPNLVHVSAETEEEYVMAHVFETHDIWHIVTGWGNDEEGEVGLGGFYIAQLNLPLIALVLSLVLINTVLKKPGSLKIRIEALSRGYEMGKAARPLFGTDWNQLYDAPLLDLRNKLQIGEGVTGEGVAGEAATANLTPTFHIS